MSEYNWAGSVKKYLENAGKRNIVIIGNDLFTLEIINTVKFLGYKVPFIVTDNTDVFLGEKLLISGEEVITKQMKKENFFLYAGLSGHKEAYQLLIQKDFQLGIDFAIMGIGGYTKLLDSIDSLLTLNRIDEDIIGFRKFTKESSDGVRIVILGNSTADPSTGNVKSWSEIIFEKFMAANIDVVIYNGAITGYSSTQEYLKLNRDVLLLEPDLVISFSGYNDVQGNSTVDKFPYLHKYQNKFYEFLKQNPKLAPDSMYVRNISNITHGLESKKKDYEIWIDNMRKMHAICTEFDIKFRAYLQPMVEYRRAVKSKEQEQIIYEFMKIIGCQEMANDEILFCDGAKQEICKYDYIKDLTGAFEGKYNVFYDTCHCTEYGNTILADLIFEDIIREICF